MILYVLNITNILILSLISLKYPLADGWTYRHQEYPSAKSFCIQLYSLLMYYLYPWIYLLGDIPTVR